MHIFYIYDQIKTDVFNRFFTFLPAAKMIYPMILSGLCGRVAMGWS